MSFARMEMLYLVWIVPCLLGLCVYGMQRRRSILKGFASGRSLEKIAPEANPGRRWIKIFLIVAALLFASVSLAGPQYGYRWRKIERKGVDLIIAIDCSRSMLATDIQPNRLERAKREVMDLVTMMQGDRIGLVAFAGTAFLQCPLTLDYQAIPMFLRALSPDFLPIGGTDIAGAIDTAAAAFDPEAPTDKAIILITDGEATGANPKAAAEAAHKKGIKLFCIGVGSRDGVPIADRSGAFVKDPTGGIVLTRLDEPMLQQIAVLTGGAYVRSVAGDLDLKRIYQDEIRGKMEAVQISGGKKKIRQDRYQWFLAVAVALLLLERFLPVARRSKGLGALVLSLVLAAGSAQASDLGQAIQQGTEAYRKGDFSAAVKHFTRAQIDAPQRPEILYNLGNAAYKAGDFESARNQFSQVISKATGALRQKAYYNLGNTSYRLGRLQEALKFYEQALKLDPEDQQARENLDFVKRMLQQQQQQNQQPQQEEKEQQERGQQQPNNGSPEKGQEQPAKPHQESHRAQPGQESSASASAQGSPESKQEDSEKLPAGSPPRYGKEMQEPAGSPDHPGEGQDPSAPPRSAADASASSGGKQTAAASRAAARSHLEHLLNRLHDKPGAATLPHYDKHQVEKDW